MPKVSVLMPVYNTKEEYLREAIESILNQTFTDFEFLICDDGSDKQETINTLNEYSEKDARIKIIKGKHNGIGSTRNLLIKEASADFCAFMDSDDISLPERLEIQLKYLIKNPNIDICGSCYEYIHDSKVIELKQGVLKYIDFLQGMPMGNPTLFFKRSSLEKYNLKYNTNISTSEDYELLSRAIKYLTISNISKTLLQYRVLQNSNSHNNIQVLKNNDNCIRKNMLDFLTDDKELQTKICDLVLPKYQPKYSFWERIFSIKNSPNRSHKVITILGFKIKIRRENAKS